MMTLGEFDNAKRHTVDPSQYPDEEFEYYSIPAYQAGQSPIITKGAEIASTKLLLEPQSVLFGKLNPRVEKVWRVRAKSGLRQIGSTEWLPIVPNGKIDVDFLYFLCWSDHVMQVAKGQVSGSTPSRQRVDPTAFYRIRVPLPPPDEQRQIALVLSAVQRAIERQELLIARTAELKKALTYKLLTGGTRGEKRKQTEIGPVPESWTVGRLDSFCVLQRGFDITKKKQTDGTVPVVSSGGIKSYHNVVKVRGPGVIVGRKGTLGLVHYVDGPYWPHDTTLWVKDFRGNDPRFTSYLLDSLDFARFDSGASNPTLNRNTIHAERVAYPPRDQQNEIGRTLAAVEAKGEVHQREARSLQSLFRTLRHQLMTAEVRVHDLDLSMVDESAEVN
jgi:type I restriction enzyme, S subunit